MLYILGTHHFYQMQDCDLPRGEKWKELIIDLYPDYFKELDDMNRRELSREEKIGEAVQYWDRTVVKEWRDDYKNELKKLIKEKEIDIIFEEANGSSSRPASLTEEIAGELNISYKNIEPSEEDRPYSKEEADDDLKKYQELVRWREKKWVESLCELYKDKKLNVLLIIGEYHRIDKIYFDKKSINIPGDSVKKLLRKAGYKITDIPEQNFWEDKAEYRDILTSIDNEAAGFDC